MSKVIHWAASVIFFVTPFIIASHSPSLDLTIGALLNAVYLSAAHYLEVK